MATVIIPETGRGDNPLTIYINGVKTTLARGVEVTVSDAVAAEIQALNGELLPVSEEPLSDGAHLPRVTDSDDGKVAKYVDGKWVPADGGGSGGGGVLVVRGHSSDSEVVLDKTWKEIHDAPFAVLRLESPDGFDVIPLASVTADDAFYVAFMDDSVYETDSENGYPSSGGK